MESNVAESCKCIARGVLVSFKVIKDELSYGERGFPIYREVLGICPDSEKSGSAWENVG